MKSADIGDVLRELYSVPPEDFTERRDALAKRLKDDGHLEAAQEIKGRQRPTIGEAKLDRARRDVKAAEADLEAKDEELKELEAQLKASKEKKER